MNKYLNMEKRYFNYNDFVFLSLKQTTIGAKAMIRCESNEQTIKMLNYLRENVDSFRYKISCSIDEEITAWLDPDIAENIFAKIPLDLQITEDMLFGHNN